MEDKETLEPQSGDEAIFDIHEEKIESLRKDEGVAKSTSASEGYLSEKTTAGDVFETRKEESLSHESEDTAMPDSSNAPAKLEETIQPAADEHIEGLKAKIILAAVTGACFIMLLDISIISTVSLRPLWVNFNISNATTNRQSLV